MLTKQDNFDLKQYNLSSILAGELTLAGPLNFEDVNYYEFTFMVRDDYLDAVTDKILAVNVTNVNEGNTITADITSVTFYENMVRSTTSEIRKLLVIVMRS